MEATRELQPGLIEIAAELVDSAESEDRQDRGLYGLGIWNRSLSRNGVRLKRSARIHFPR